MEQTSNKEEECVRRNPCVKEGGTAYEYFGTYLELDPILALHE